MLKQNLRQGAVGCGEGDQGGSPLEVTGKKGLGILPRLALNWRSFGECWIYSTDLAVT